jgi:hypothetical protein
VWKRRPTSPAAETPSFTFSASESRCILQGLPSNQHWQSPPAGMIRLRNEGGHGQRSPCSQGYQRTGRKTGDAVRADTHRPQSAREICQATQVNIDMSNALLLAQSTTCRQGFLSSVPSPILLQTIMYQGNSTGQRRYIRLKSRMGYSAMRGRIPGPVTPLVSEPHEAYPQGRIKRRSPLYAVQRPMTPAVVSLRECQPELPSAKTRFNRRRF